MTSPARIPVAIIGMACRLPGADNLAEFWRLVVEGRHAIVELPPDRLDQELYYDERVGQIGKTYSKLGAIISSRQFDRQACPLPESLIRSVDNAHLLMCQTAAEALRHAGFDPFAVPLRNTGVYIGHAQGSTLGGDLTYASYAEEAAEILREVPEFGDLPADQQQQIISDLVRRIRGPLPQRTVESADVACNLVAGVISQAFGLNGPYLALNSACASSLQAMLVAARALQLGRVDMAIAGGASDCKSDSLVLFAHARAMSSQGSRPFDAEADGLIVGEGYAAVVLKTLPRALADGDRVLAVIRGLGVSSDGKGKSLWAPRKEGQTLAMRRAYREGLDVGQLDYLEAHATATQLGDATELNTLADVLADKLPPGKKVPITSVKASIGHTLETAGIAGVIKTVLALEHNTIPPAASLKDLNPKIDWQRWPVYVPRQPTPWQPHADGRPRRAGVNAFGIGGLNMHVIVEEFNDASRRLAAESPAVQSRDHDAVAVIGMGCVWPGARGTEAYWKLLTSGSDPKVPVPPDRWQVELVERPAAGRDLCIHQPRGGFITDFVYDWQKHKIPPKQVAQADPLQFMLLDAADQAVKQAGYDRKPLDNTGVGVVVGTEFGGDFAFQLQMGLRLPELRRHIGQLLAQHGVSADGAAAVEKKYSQALLARWPALIDETGSFSTSSLASRTAKTWNLMGGAAAIDAGQGSSLAALALAVDALLAGDCDMMLCAAGQRRLGLPEFEALTLTGMLAADPRRSSPLDADAHGYTPGEGVGVLLLKRLSDARRDGDRVLAVVRGVGMAQHADAGQAFQLALERSLAPSGAAADDVQVLELDGAAAMDDRAAQRAALGAIYGQRTSSPLRVSTVAGQIGHTEAAAGMASLVKASLEMNHHLLPRPVGIERPASFGAAREQLTVVDCDTPLTPAADRPLLAAVATRSRGLTCHAVLESGETAMRNTQPAAQQPLTSSLPRAASPRPVAATAAPAQPQTLPAALPAGGVRPKVVFCFSGQGSQYAGMAQALVEQSPAATAALREADAVLARYGYPSFAEFAWGDATGLGKNPWLTQLSLLVADGLFLAALGEQGIRPDEVLGHSYGEYPALVAAGGMNFETALILTRARCDGVAAARVEGGMLAVSAGRAEVQQWIDQSGLAVSVATHNAPQQTVVGGAPQPLAEFHALLSRQKVLSQMIAVPAPFHTPLMKAVAGHFERIVGTTQMATPRMPQWSVATNRRATSAEDVRSNLVSLLSEPVLYVDLIEAVVQGGPCVLVEVGPQEVLTKLHRRIVQRPDVACVACDAPKGSGAAGIAQVRAVLEQAGYFAAASRSSVVAAPPGKRHSLLVFDATARRRERMRQAAASGKAPRAAATAAAAAAPAKPAPAAKPAPPVAEPAPVAPMTTAEAPVIAAIPAPSGVDLERFLINFVVEQTGYPPEVVELDADLEADLGIDSIKKAQLFGELQEYFDVTPSADLTLDMFPTLRHVLDFLRTAPTKGDLVLSADAPTTAAPVAEAAAPAAQTPVSAAVPAAAAADLEKFLINFVVEQTGYPPEVVELDADLEADLGIDSIKKAQLFGELQEYFDVTPSADLTLDMFPTLRHVLDFLRTAPTKGDLATVTTAAIAASPTPPAAAVETVDAEPVAARADELEKFLINFVVEQTGYPPEVVELDADLEADLGIDSIKKAQLFGELQEYFDVTPSADLTLDMFPTLRHVLDFLRTAPTKGDLAMVAATSLASPPASAPQPTQPLAPLATAAPAPPPAPVDETPALEQPPPHALPQGPRVVTVAGTPYEMGREHGAALRDEIRRALRVYADLSPQYRDELPGVRAGDDLRARFSDDELDELQGIADGAEVLLDSVLWHNLAAVSDLGAAHAQRVAAERSPAGLTHAAAWSTPLLAALGEAVAPVVVVRQPLLGAPYAVVAPAGCIGGLLGVNAHGLSVSGGGETSPTAQGSWTRSVGRLLSLAADVEDATAELVRKPVAGQFVLGQVDALELAAVDGQGRVVDQTSGERYVALGGGSAQALATAQERVQQLMAGGTGHRGSAIQLADSALAQPMAESVAVQFDEPAGALAARLEVRRDDARLYLVGGDGDGGGVSLGPLLGLSQRPARPVKPTGPAKESGSQSNGHRNGNGRAPHAVATPAEKDHSSRTSAAVEVTTLPEPAHKPPVHPAVVVPAPAASSNPLDSRRFVLRTVPAPFPRDAPQGPIWHGPAILVGEHPAAAALAEMIQRSGFAAHRVAASSVDEAERAVRQICAAGPAPHLFLFSAPEDSAWDDGDAFLDRLERHVRVPYFAVQAWTVAAVAGKWLDGGTVTAVTSLGGALGFDGAVDEPLGGALAGLLKALFIEFHILQGHKRLLTKIIDAPRNEDPRGLAENVAREIAFRQEDYEVAFRGGQRFLQNAVHGPLTGAGPSPTPPSGVWLVTGGARGITAACALSLAKTYPVRLCLLGTTPLSQFDPAWRNLDEAGLKALKTRVMVEAQRAGKRPSDAWEAVSKCLEIDQSLERFRQAGVDFSYDACDVSNPQALAEALERIRGQHGPICGVLHGAGIERACRFEKKTVAGFDATLGPKVLGAYHLMRLTRNDPVRHFVGFGSVSGRLGSNGQADYCTASDLLAKLMAAHARWRPDCRSIAFHWHPWDDIGMAARPETRGAFQMSDAPALMPQAQGLAHFLAELCYRDDHAEALITSAEYFERFYGKGAADRRAETPAAVSAATTAAPTLVARRHVLTSAAGPLPFVPDEPKLTGAALVLGDNPDAAATVAWLRGLGCEVQQLTGTGDAAQTLAQLDALWAAGPAQHLFLLTARDAAAGRLETFAQAELRRERGLWTPLLVTQRWLRRLRETKPTGPAHLVAVTALGGDCGIASPTLAPEGGALAGLVKSVFVESARHPAADVRPKFVDLPTDAAPAEVVAALRCELAAARTDIEVGYRNGQRWTVEVTPQTAPADPDHQPARGGVWVATGGARGITAQSALALGKRFGLKLHLVGASPAPPAQAPWLRAAEDEIQGLKRQIVQAEVAAGRSPEDAWNRVKKAREITATLDKFRAAGVAAVYHSCDVADRGALARTLDEIRRQDGPLAGVLHGAGFARPGRLELKDAGLMRKAVLPKFDGTLALAELTAGDPLRHFVMFGSISGRFGGNGLADYAAANEAMSKLAVYLRRRRPECRATCIAWQTWDETGMAMLSDGVAINRNQLDSQYISVREGTSHVVRELEAGLPDAEVVITDGTFEKNFYGAEALAQRAIPWRSAAVTTDPAAASKTGSPLIESWRVTPDGGEATITLDPTRDPFLIDHRLRAAPFLPGVVALSALAQAAAAAAPGQSVVGLADVEIVQGIKFPAPQPATAHVRAKRNGDSVAASLTVEVRTRQGKLVEAARPCSGGRVLLSAAPSALSAAAPLVVPTDDWHTFVYPDEALLWHGPRLRALKQCIFEADGGWGRIVAPDPAELSGWRGGAGWQLPLAVLDACVVTCGSFLFIQFGGRLEVPHRFERLQLGRLPRAGENCMLRFLLRDRHDDRPHSRFDFTLWGDAGEPLVDVRGYHTVLITERVPVAK